MADWHETKFGSRHFLDVVPTRYMDFEITLNNTVIGNLAMRADEPYGAEEFLTWLREQTIRTS